VGSRIVNEEVQTFKYKLFYLIHFGFILNSTSSQKRPFSQLLPSAYQVENHLQFPTLVIQGDVICEPGRATFKIGATPRAGQPLSHKGEAGDYHLLSQQQQKEQHLS
jgi:hypothetical protein